MASAAETLKRSKIGGALERRLGKRVQRYRFWRAMRRFMREVHLGHDIDRDLIEELVSSWGNRWSAQHEFLDACLKAVRQTSGPVLECGSGLSTLLLGTVAQSRGIQMWTLENEPKWAAETQDYLRKYRIHAVTMSLAPLRSFGDFDWYSLPSLQTIPGKISLAICDGPPGATTRGGRMGLVPVMLEKLRPDCIILLDDGARPEELGIAGRWAQMLNGTRQVIGTEKPFICVQAGKATPIPPKPPEPAPAS